MSIGICARSRRSPPISATISSMARCITGGGAPSWAAEKRRVRRSRSARSFFSGNPTPVTPRSLQAMPQRPIAVSKSVKPISLMMPNIRTYAGGNTRFLIGRLSGLRGDCVVVGLHGDAQRLWDRPRPAPGDEGDAHVRLDHKVVPAHDPLAQRN